MRQDIIRKERLTQGEKFYPIHLENEEIFSIIDHVLEGYFLYGHCTINAFVRKDRGAKGVDFRIRITKLWQGEAHPDRQYTFGINSNWELEGFFDHWVSLGGKFAAKEIDGRELAILEQILCERTARRRPLVRNSFFEGDEWTCVYQQCNRLSA